MVFNWKLATTGLVVASAVSAHSQIRVMVNGDPVQFENQGPMMSGDRVLVPLRGVLERMGAQVDWNPDSQTVSARRAGTEVKLHIGETDASIGGQPITLDVPAQIVNGSTMVPLRFIGEALGEHVRWDADTRTVRIQTGRAGSQDYNVPRVRQGGGRPQHLGDGDSTSMSQTFDVGTVFEVRLHDSLSPDASSKGDRFSATLVSRRGAIPDGARIQGRVTAVRPARDNRPGFVQLAFDKLVMPNGDHYDIDGSLVFMTDQSVVYQNGRPVRRASGQARRAFGTYSAGDQLRVKLNQPLTVKSQ